MWQRRFLLLTLSALLVTSPWTAESQGAGTPTPTPTPTPAPLPPAGPLAGPVFSEGFPQVINVGAGSLDIAVALDRYGKVVYAVARAGYNEPLPKSVATKFSTAYGDGVVATGDFTSVGRGLVAYQDVSGSLAPELPDILQPGESYKIFLIPVDARDGAHNGVLSKIEVTMADEGAPVYTSGHPMLQNPTSATFDVVLSVQQSSILHYVALPSGDDLQVALDDLGISTPEGGSMQRILQGGLPSLRAMQQASTFFAGVAQNPKFTLPIYANNTVHNIEVRDLEPGKDYKVFFALQDMPEPNSTSGQFMEAVMKRSISTLAMPLPPPSPPPPPPPPSLPPAPNPPSPPLQPPPPQIYGLRPPPPATGAGNSSNVAPPVPIPSRTVYFQAVFADASASSLLSAELDLDILKQLFLAALELAVTDVLSLAIGNPVFRPQTSVSVDSVTVGSIILQANVEFTGFLEVPTEQAAIAFQSEVESGGSIVTSYIARDLKLAGLGPFRTFAQGADVSQPWPPSSEDVPTPPITESGHIYVIIGGSTAVVILLALLAGYVLLYRKRAAEAPAETDDDLQWGRSMMSLSPSSSSRKLKPTPTKKIAVTPAASEGEGDYRASNDDDSDGGADAAAEEQDAIRSSSRQKEPAAKQEGGKLRRAYTFHVADRDVANVMLGNDKRTSSIRGNLLKHSSSMSRSRIIRDMSSRAEAELEKQQHQQGDAVSGTGSALKVADRDVVNVMLGNDNRTSGIRGNLLKHSSSMSRSRIIRDRSARAEAELHQQQHQEGDAVSALHNSNENEVVPAVTTAAPGVTSNGVSSSSPRRCEAQGGDDEDRQDPGPLAAAATRHDGGTRGQLSRTKSMLRRNAAALLLEHSHNHQQRQR